MNFSRIAASSPYPVEEVDMFRGMMAAGILATSLPVAAADMQIFAMHGSDKSFIQVSGEIVEGDAERFFDLVRGIDGATVLLESPGGLIQEAFSIGAEIYGRNFATLVLPESECYSACALIWLAGGRRYLSSSSVIGVHAAYYEAGDGSLNVAGAGNAEIGAFLSAVGLRREAIRYITTAEPDEDFLFLTPEISRKLGIEVFEQDGLETTTPAEAPTAPVIAYDTATLIAFESTCGLLFGTGGRAQRTAEEHLQGGHENYGGEIFVGLIVEAVESTKAAISRDGEIAWCLGSSVNLARSGFDIGIDGPGFDCAHASTVNERTICASSGLWGLDRALSTFYGLARTGSAGAVRSQIEADQVAWLKARQSCGADVDCTSASYYRRIGALLP